MGIIKKLATCGVICLLSISMVACNGSTADASKTQEETKTASSENVETSEDVAIAKVGDQEILKSELKLQLDYQKMYLTMSNGEDFLQSDQGKAQLSQMKDYLVEQLINMKIARIKAEELKQMPSDEDVAKIFNEQKENVGSEEAFKQALEASKMTEEDLKEEIQTSLIIENIKTYIGKDVKVTDDEVKQYYKDNVDQFTDKAGANISHILVATEEEAQKVKEEYDAGASFADLAAKYGTDGTKSTGGSLGFIEYSTKNYDADFMAAAKKLGEGEVSGPVKTQFGYHIIKVEGIRKEDIVKAFDEVKEEASATFLSQKQNECIKSTLEEWRKELGVEKYDDIIATVE